MIRRILLACALVLPLAAFQCTGSTGQPVVLTASTAPSLIIAEMKKGCADLMANQALVNIAVATATKALQDTQGTISSVSNAASIGCSLLVPPPAAPAASTTVSG